MNLTVSLNRKYTIEVVEGVSTGGNWEISGLDKESERGGLTVSKVDQIWDLHVWPQDHRDWGKIIQLFGFTSPG